MNNPTRMTEDEVRQQLARYNSIKREKYQWQIHYQIISEYFQTIKADFTINFVPGMFLNRDLYDSTGPKAGNVMAGALLGMLWPEESVNFQIIKARNISDSEENRNYFNEISHRMWSAMSDLDCGLSLALNEYMRDQVFFGTSGIAVFEPTDPNLDEDCHFLFQPWDIKRMVIDEAPNGYVNRVYYEREETVEQTVLEFGIENVSQKTRDAYMQGGVQLLNKIIILHTA
jgi:hypothetical protein